MSVEHEIRELLSRYAPPDPKLFAAPTDGSEVAVAAEDLLGIILKQDALEQAVRRLAARVNQL